MRQHSVLERDRRGQDPIGGWGGERKTSACEEEQDEGADRRDRDPEPRGRRARQVASDHELEHARDRQEHDQELEPVLLREVSDPAHVLKVAHPLAGRFERKAESESSLRGGSIPAI